jgi:hypothetical protein
VEYGGPFGISANRAYQPGAVVGAKISRQTNVLDQKCTVKIPVMNGQCGPFVRSDGLGKYHYFASCAIGSKVILYKLVNGTYTSINDGSTTPKVLTSGDMVSISAAGSTVTVAVNGLVIISQTDTSISGPGSAGFITSDATTFIDDVSIIDLVASVALLASFVSADSAAVRLTAVGGTGPWQWYRSTTFGFTPGAGDLLSGQTGQTLTDTTAAPGVLYEYVILAPASLEQSRVCGKLGIAPLFLGFIGDGFMAGKNGSVTAGGEPPVLVGRLLQKTGVALRAVTVVNQGVTGSKSADWVTGSANLTAAKSAFSAAGVVHVPIALGYQDALAGVAPATVQGNLTSLCTDLAGAGYVPILNYPTWINPAVSGATVVNALASYLPSIDAVISAGKAMRGDVSAWAYFAEHSAELYQGATFQTDVSALSWAACLAGAITRVVAAPPPPPGVSGARTFGGM